MDIAPEIPTVGFLLTVASIAILSLLVLIMRFKVHAFVALTLVSLLTAIVTGIRTDAVVPLLLRGFGNTLASVALLVGFGAMIGRMLEVSGGAKVLADSLIDRFGPERAPLALGVASLLFGFPIFFDAGLVVMLPIIFQVARRFGGSLLTYALPAAGAFAVMHAWLPPHPGPVVAGELLGANLGLLTVVALIIALPTWYLGSYLFGLWVGKRWILPVPGSTVGDDGGKPDQLPGFFLVLSVLLLPLVLIFMDTGLHTAGVLGFVDPESSWVRLLRMVGKTPVALLITVLYGLVLFGKSQGRERLETICNEALGPVCAVILVTGAGGMFGGVLRESGIGPALAETLAATGMPLIVAAFLIAAGLRVAQGSATVALTTAAALIAPAVTAASGMSELDRCFVVIAIAGGATILSHVNDSGFWLVGRFLQMNEATTLKTWTLMVTLIGFIAFGFAALGSIFF
jgi:gluconate:H+ symporter, GntP family